MIYSTLGMEKACFILLICAPGCSLLQIIGILHRDVLLPCIVTYNDVFNYKDLVVNWQRENEDVLHSYHYEADQHQYQAKEFQGRTQLFPEEFPNGNLSLLLKHTQTSDAGRYICHVFLNDHKGFTTKTMELVLPSLKGITGDQIDTSHPDEATTEIRTQSNEDGEKEKRVNWMNIALPSLFVILILLVILVIVSKRKQIIFCKNVDNITWMTAHGNTTEKARLLENDSLKEHVFNYKTSVLNTFEPCCPSSSSEHKQHGCLERTLRVLEEPKQQHHNCEIIKDMFKSKDSAEILSSEKFFTTKNINLSSRRKLLLGEAGIGKSCFSKGLQSHWAVGDKDIFYECIIYFTFTEMNSIKKSLSVKELLGNKCKELEPVLPQLLLSDKLLIAFDGLDEFRFDLTENQPLDVLNIDTPLHINLLVSYILSKKLLPDTDVLVTSRPNSLSKFHQYFDKIYAMEGFNDDQFVQYLKKFASSLEIATSVNEVVKKSKMSSLVSIPLLSSAVCEISKKQHFLKCKGRLNTSSQIMVTLLKCCVREAIYSTETSDTKCCVQDLESGLQLPDNIMKVICNIAKVSYENLVHGVDEIDLQGLWESCKHTKHLLKSFSDFFFKKTKHTRTLEYHHAVIRDMFAALHCVWEIKDMTELKECLDAWAWGEITDLQRNGSLLQDITLKHPIVLRNFLRFFVGLLNYKNVHSLLSDDPIHSKEMLSFLHQWIQDGLRRTSEANHLNLYHWIFELHNASLNEKLSDYHKNVKLFNTPLTMLDVRALQFSLETSSLESIDLTLCDLSDENLQQLQNVVKKCKHVTLSSNKLTVDTAHLLQQILQTPDCSIEHLRLGTNRLGSRGAQCIWKSLETNRSLRVLSLKDNQIEDEGTEGMVHSLKMNCTLDELYLCMNNFTELGIRNIAELRQQRRDLKVVVKLCEDEELLHYVDGQVRGLNGDGWKQYEKEWLLQILQIVHKDLSDDEATNENCREKVKCIREEILEKINIINETKAHTPLKMNQNKNEISQEIKIIGEKSLHRVSENLNIISAIVKI